VVRVLPGLHAPPTAGGCLVGFSGLQEINVACRRKVGNNFYVAPTAVRNVRRAAEMASACARVIAPPTNAVLVSMAAKIVVIFAT
jgi:hypothetical protein